MGNSPAFQFYPADFLADENVSLMSLAGRGAYITLMCYCWREGSIPADLRKMAKLCGIDSSAIAELWQELEPCFELANDRYVHPRLERERAKQEEHKKERSEAGKRGASQRWNSQSKENKDVADNSSAIAQPMAQPMAKNGSSSSISSSSSSSSKKTVVEGLPHETSPENDTNATTTICDGIAETIRSYLNIPETAGWKTQGDVKSIALELADLGATAAQVAEFIKTRQKPPGKAYWSQDFLKWRASQPASAPTERKITKAPADYLKLYEGGKKSA